MELLNQLVELEQLKIEYFSHDEPVELNGEWEFVPGKLLSSSEFANQKTYLVQVPSLWTSYVLDGEKVPKYTSGTYRLKIKIDDADNILGIKTSNIRNEYKNKTISLSFSYPISRKKLFMAKVLFLSLFVFLITLVSFLLTGITTYLLDEAFSIINGQPTGTDISTFFIKMISHSIIITLISLIPLFLFGLWKRATIPLVLCAIFLMQFQNFSYLLKVNLNPGRVNFVRCILGAASAYLSIKLVDKLGDI